MLTIFSTSKPFTGHNAVIQLNAIGSWLKLRPRCEIILFGDDKGTLEVAQEFGIIHVPDIACNEHGTPLLSDMFRTASEMASFPILCYVNADIILLSDFLPAIGSIDRKPYLAIGQRWDLNVDERLNFNKQDWEVSLRRNLAISGKLHAVTGIDYFVFPPALYQNLPPFAIGRSAWDNWLIYHARRQGIPVIDATQVITIIHQNHDYGHIASPQPESWKGIEFERNLSLLGGMDRSFTLEHATLILTPQGIRPALTLRHLYFRLAAVPMLFRPLHFLRWPMRALTWLIIGIRSVLGITRN